MNCCTTPKNHLPYRATERPGWAIACKKCGKTRLATTDEALQLEAAEES